MVVEVYKGSTYMIMIVRDENERVVGIMPVKTIDFYKRKKEVAEEISDFWLKVGVLPPAYIVFHRNEKKLLNFVSDTFKEAEKKLEEKIERIKRLAKKTQ